MMTKIEIGALPACTRPLPTAFVINLDRDTVRLTHMEAECARVGIFMQRWPAMLGAALPPALASSFVTPSSGSAWSLQFRRNRMLCQSHHDLAGAGGWSAR